MTATEAIRNFIEFYLSSRVPTKTIELACLRTTHSIKEEDAFLDTVAGFRKAIQLLKKHQKEMPQFASQLRGDEALSQGYLNVILMSPEDCLLMIAGDRFNIKDHLLSLILKRPEDHLQFKRSQLVRGLNELGVSFNPKQEIHSSHFVPVQNRTTLYQKFRTLPFVVRFTIEASVVLLTLVSLMWVIPEIRNSYENAIQKRINDYLIESSLVDAPPPQGTTKTPKQITLEETQTESQDQSEKDVAENTAARKQPKVNDGETWRFSFTGASTTDLESGIIDAIKQQGVESPKPVTVPGGIQFDIELKIDKLLPLKIALENMVSKIKSKGDASAHAANMSWYKKKNMGTRKIAPGQVQAVIWISTL